MSNPLVEDAIRHRERLKTIRQCSRTVKEYRKKQATKPADDFLDGMITASLQIEGLLSRLEDEELRLTSENP